MCWRTRICRERLPISSPPSSQRHRQVDAGDDREVLSLLSATVYAAALVPVSSPQIEGLRTSSPVLGGRKVIAVKMEEVADLIMSREEPLCLAGWLEALHLALAPSGRPV